jgi:hypothetical protein
VQQQNLAIDSNPSANYDSNISEPFSDTQEPPNAEMWQEITQQDPGVNLKTRSKSKEGNKIKQMMNFNDESELHEVDHQRVHNNLSLKLVQSKITTKAKSKHKFARPETDVFIEGDEDADVVEELPQVNLDPTTQPKPRMKASMEESIDLLDQGVKNRLDKFKF